MRYSRHIAILVGFLCLTLCLGSGLGGRVAPAMEKDGPQAEDRMIFLETFMVEVPLSELYKLGVPSVSEGVKSVSAEQVLACIEKPRTGAVTAGAKLAIGQDAEATTETSKHWGYYAGPPKEQEVQFLDQGLSLKAKAAVMPGGRIAAVLEFQHGSLNENDEKNKILPAITEKRWSCKLVLDPGKHTLAGATQDEQTAVFLLVTANIMK